jgi:acyl-CoA thioester hydrolase
MPDVFQLQSLLEIVKMTPKPPNGYEIALQIPFHDLDPMHIVWHGNYLKYFDQARFALFRNVGIDLYEYYQKTGTLFPITKTSTKHIIPLVYGDQVGCRATVVDAGVKIVIDFAIRRMPSGEICTKGRSEQVAVKAPEMIMMFEIPADIRQALGF